MQPLIDKRFKQADAARLLNLSIRYIKRLLRTYREQGADGLIPTRRSKPSNHQEARKPAKPVGRSKFGSKHHMLVESQGIPLLISLTANRHDISQPLMLVESIPQVRGRRGGPRQKPKKLQGDRAYDSKPHRRALKKKRSSR